MDLPESEVYTIDEIAAKFQLSKMTVYRLIHGGVLPAYRVGRSIRVMKTDWEQYLESIKYPATFGLDFQ